jgi:hypothetical protein
MKRKKRVIPVFLLIVVFVGSPLFSGAHPGARAPGDDDEEIALHVIPGVVEIGCGVAFPLTVVRVWPRELIPDDWSEGALSPLSARLVETSRRERGNRIEETRRYVCHAFRPGTLSLPPLTFTARPREGGDERMAVSLPVSLAVIPALDRAAPGPVELPGGMPPLSDRWNPLLPWGGAALLACLAAAAWFLLAMARRRAGRAASSDLPPKERALDRLRLLRGGNLESTSTSGREIDLFYVEASNLIRDYIAERFRLPARERTTTEFLASLRTAGVFGESHRLLLGRFFEGCDGVKFGRRPSTPPDRERILERADRFVRETDRVGEEEA